MLGPAASARSNTSSKAGASAAARDAAGHARPAADRAVARCTATESCVHQRRAQAVAAAWRRAGGARSLRRRTKSRTRATAPVPQRPPTSEPSTTRRWGPLQSSSGYVASLRRVAVANAAPSVSAERPCGCPLFPFSPPYLRNSPNGTYLGPAMRSSRACLAAAARHGTAPSLPQFRVREVCGRLPGLGRGRVVGQPVVGVVGRPGRLGSRLRHPPRFSELLPIGEAIGDHLYAAFVARRHVNKHVRDIPLPCVLPVTRGRQLCRPAFHQRVARVMVAVQLQASSARAVRTQPAASPACDSSSTRVVDVVEERQSARLSSAFDAVHCQPGRLPGTSLAQDGTEKAVARNDASESLSRSKPQASHAQRKSVVAAGGVWQRHVAITRPPAMLPGSALFNW